jgi:SWI/SNF-related matrix-associated actin-dependent regulator of chromatin subfamily A3
VRGGILADTMGLGKTLQIIALIVLDKASDNNHAAVAAPPSPRPQTLVVAPATVIQQWERQARELTQGLLNVTRFHGPERGAIDLSAADLVITTYGTLVAEAKKVKSGKSSPLFARLWHRAVLDEVGGRPYVPLNELLFMYYYSWM